jgi:HAMP domain-containing protein
MTRSLGSRLSWAATFFVLMLVIAIGLVIFFGFRSSMQSGLRAGASELETQTEQAVSQIVVREAELYSQTLERAATVAHIAAEAFQTTEGFQTLELVRGAEGQWYDPNPARKSEVMVAPFYDVEKTLADQLDSASLETLLPNLLAQIPNGVAIYYVGTSGLLRYYPVINIEGTSSSTLDVLKHPLFTGADPTQNPERKAVWTSPYQDDAIFGLLTTMSVPVYSGEVFRGVIGVDVSLENFRQLEQLNISKQSYGFVMDAATNLIAAPEEVITLLAWGNTSPQLGQPLRDVAQADFISVLETMTKGTAGSQHLRLKEKPYVIAYAPIRATGWQLGVVKDHAEMTKPIDNFATTFFGDALRILTLVILLTVVLFLVGLFAIRAFSHRYLTRPVKHLLQTTQALANGELGIQAKVDSEDELGQLGHSLNAMSTKLAQAKE